MTELENIANHKQMQKQSQEQKRLIDKFQQLSGEKTPQINQKSVINVSSKILSQEEF